VARACAQRDREQRRRRHLREQRRGGVLENTQPAPSGSRHVGRDACLAVWQALAGATGSQFSLEEVFVAGERALIRWHFRFGPTESDFVRGVNWMRTRDGQIVEAMGHVKGV